MSISHLKIGIDARSLDEKRTGIGRYLFNLLREWKDSASGHEFFLYRISKTPLESFLQERPFFPRELRFIGEGQRDIFEAELMENPPDVFFSPLFFLPSPLAVPSVITVHDLVHLARPRDFTEIQLAYLNEAVPSAIQRAGRILTDSSFARGEISKFYPEAVAKTQIVPLAPDPIFRVKPFDPVALRRRFGIREKFLLYVGSISHKRHILELVEAFRESGDLFQNFQLFLIGQNFFNPPLDFEKNLPPGVIYREFVPDEDLADLMNAAFAFIYLSSYEGFGLPPLEAMACGCPIITSRQAALEEVVGDTALFVEAPEADRIREALREIIENDGLRTTLKERGLKHAALFSWRETAAQTLRILEQGNWGNV
ncbi:MAG: glycosyltransferase family 1 protein [bacterium]